MLGDGGQFVRLRLRQPHTVGLALKVGEAIREHRERIENTAEQNIKKTDHDDVEHDGHRPDRHGVVPHLGDFIGRLADNFHVPDPQAVDSHGDIARLDRRRDQRRKPTRGSVALGGGAAGRRHRDGRTRGVADHEPHMAHRLQLRRQRRQKLLGRKLLTGEMDGVLHQQIGKAHRSGHLDARLHARAQDDDAAGNEHRDDIDQHEYEQELGANRALMPERTAPALQQSRRLRRPCKRGRELYADRCLPLGAAVLCRRC